MNLEIYGMLRILKKSGKGCEEKSKVLEITVLLQFGYKMELLLQYLTLCHFLITWLLVVRGSKCHLQLKSLFSVILSSLFMQRSHFTF